MSSIENEKFKIVKGEAPYVPSPIAPEFHAKYIQENYVTVSNSDGSVSYVKKDK